MMDPAPPTTHVWHGYYGDLVVVAQPQGVPGIEVQTKTMEGAHGPGTWVISLAAHNHSLRTMDQDGIAEVTSDDFRWVPWSELRLKEKS